MKDLSKLTDVQHNNLLAGKWWDPAPVGTGGNGPTKPVEIVGEPVANQITGDLIIAVRRSVKLKAFPLTVERLIAKYAPREAVPAAAEAAPEPQMTLPLDAPPWAARLLADVAFLVKEAKSRGTPVP